MKAKIDISKITSEKEALEEYSVTENVNGINIRSKINLCGITKDVSILLTNDIITNFEINQINSILSNFFKIFEDKKIGILPMEDIVEETNFSDILLVYKNGKPILLVQWNSTRVIIEFDNKYIPRLRFGPVLQYVPDEFITAELCLEAVKDVAAFMIDNSVLKYVPEKLKTAELCLEAVKHDGSALKYVPDKLITEELCLEAVKQDKDALEYVPTEIQDEVRSMYESSKE